MRDDPFADLDKLRLTPEATIAVDRTATAKRTKQRSRDPFTKFPHSWEAQLLKTKRISTYRVALHLLYMHWRAGGHPIPLSNVSLSGKGVSRRSKWNALAELARLGLIRIEKSSRKSPLIRIVRGG